MKPRRRRWGTINETLSPPKNLRRESLSITALINVAKKCCEYLPVCLCPPLPAHLAIFISKFDDSILPAFSHPSLYPSLHLSSPSSSANIYCRYHFLNPQCTYEHRQLPEATVFAVRNAETGCFSCAPTLWHQFCHAVRRAPIGGVQNSRYRR